VNEDRNISGEFAVVVGALIAILCTFNLASELWRDPITPAMTSRMQHPWQVRAFTIGGILVGWRTWVIGRRIVAKEREDADQDSE